MATWSIIKTINQGGFGIVYEVRSSDGKRGALKELKNPDAERLKRFEREINILKNLNHTHIIDIYEWNLKGSPPTVKGPYYIMEYMAGGSLKTMMYDMFNVRKGLFAQKWTLGNIIFPIIDALLLAHDQDIYHRDLKPENLLFTEQNQIKVADWGLGKDVNRESIARTVAGLGGTPGYAAPEQWAALDSDDRADIFSLGVIFYEMMTGKMPSTYDNAWVRPQVISPSKFHPSIATKSPQLDHIILKMIEIKREKGYRYQTILEVKNVLTPIYNSM